MSDTLGHVLTFYSYKGGVGRSFALADVAVALARWGFRVLCMDWDLEAPGLDHFFVPWREAPTADGLLEWIEAFTQGAPLAWRGLVEVLTVPGCIDRLHFISAGNQGRNYASRVQELSWPALLYNAGFGRHLEDARAEWAAAYDFVLVDSRTGLSDIGGVCTVQIPDTLVVLFTPNRQSMEGAMRVARSAMAAQRGQPIDRAPMRIIPVATRVEVNEYENYRAWFARIAEASAPFFAAWGDIEGPALDAGALVQRLAVPQVPFWSYGEQLAVLRDDALDSRSVRYAHDALAALIARELDDPRAFLQDRDGYVKAAETAGGLRMTQGVDALLAGPRGDAAQVSARQDAVTSEERGGTDGLLRTVVRLEGMAKVEPERRDYQYDLALSHLKLADTYAANGRAVLARDSFQNGIAILVRLAATEPERADYQRNLSVSYSKVGDLYVALAQGDRARDAYQNALEIAERLAKAEPDREDHQRELSVSYNKMGDLYQALGQGDRARDAYRNALQIAERLAKAEPDRANYQRDLSISYSKMGDLYRGLGQGDRARDAYQNALQIAERLAKAEPNRADYQRDLSVSYNKMGDLYVALGQGDRARDAYQRDLEIAERLAEAEPDRADYQRDLSVSYNKMGDLYRALGLGDRARDAYQNALQIAERLAKAEPDRVDYERDLSISYHKMGDSYRALGQGDRARDAYQKGLQISERIAKAEPDRVDPQYDLVSSLQRIASVAINDGRLSDAVVSYEQALAGSERLVALAPQQVDFHLSVVSCCVLLAQVAPDRAPSLLQRALDELLALDRDGRLPPNERGKLDDVRSRLAKL